MPWVSITQSSPGQSCETKHVGEEFLLLKMKRHRAIGEVEVATFTEIQLQMLSRWHSAFLLYSIMIVFEEI